MIVGSSPTPRATPLVRAEKLLADTTARASDVSRIGTEIVSGDIGEARSLGGHLNVLTNRIDDLAHVSARAGNIEAASHLDQMSEAIRPIARAAVFPPGATHRPLEELAHVGHAASDLGRSIANILTTLTATQLLTPTRRSEPSPGGELPPNPAADEAQAAAAAAATAEAQAQAAAAAEAPAPGPIADDGAGMLSPADAEATMALAAAAPAAQADEQLTPGLESMGGEQPPAPPAA